MKQRVNVMLEPETVQALILEAKQKGISVSAVARQRITSTGIPQPTEEKHWNIVDPHNED